MPKVAWEAADEDEVLTAEDIDEAEAGYTAYTGEIPRGGVYRFLIGRMRFNKASTGSQGLSVRMRLDGTWKPAHKAYDGCPFWDRIWMTKAAAGFVKAFAMAIGVSSDDIVNKVITDEDGYVTKIGRKKIVEDEIVVYCAVKQETYNDEVRLAKAGTGFQVVETEEPAEDEADEEPPKKGAKAAPATAAKGKTKKSKKDDEEPPF